MKDTMEKFDGILHGLRYGDHQLYIPPTTNPETLEHLHIVDKLWAPLKEELQNVEIKGYANMSDIVLVSSLATPLDEELHIMLHIYESMVGDAEETLLPDEVIMALDYAGDQRILSQKMVAEYLFVVVRHEEEKHLAGLQEDVVEFDKILQALYNGNVELGLHAAESTDLIKWLDRCSEIWEGENGFKAVLSAEPTYFMLDYLASQNIPLLGRLNVVVGLYKNIATTPPAPPSEPPPPFHTLGWNNGSNSLLGACTLFLAGVATIYFEFLGNFIMI